MGVLGRLHELIGADIRDLVDRAKDPLRAARHLVKEMEDGISDLRGRVKVAEARAESAKQRIRDTKRAADEWTRRAERAVEEGKEALARTAISRKIALLKEAKSREEVWWTAVGEKESLAQQLRELEDRVQQVRRHRDSHAAKHNRGRPSSEYAVVPRESCGAAEAGTETTEVDNELQRLKEIRSNRAGGPEASARCD